MAFSKPPTASLSLKVLAHLLSYPDATLRAHLRLALGKATTPFLVDGQVVRIHMSDAAGRNLFGDIQQRVVSA